MNAHAAATLYARAPLALRRAPPRSASSRRRHAPVVARSPHVFGPSAIAWFWTALLSGCTRVFALFLALAPRTWESGVAAVRSLPINAKTSTRILFGALLGGMVVLAVVNNARIKPDAIGLMSDPNETVVYRQNADQAASLQREAMRRGLMQRGSMRLASIEPASSMRLASIETASVPPSSVEDEGEPSADEAEENVSLFQRVVRTIKFTNTTDVDAPGAMTRVGAFIAFPGKQASQPATSDANEWPAVRRHKGAANMDEVDRYLWEVYQRAPIKKDHSGDFTWKDPAAAKRMDLSLPEYVIGGMDPDFREQLYHAGRAMDAAGIQWSMLSAFRDDYRQKLAAGYKARVGNSLHGGSRATGGYGHGRAIDLTTADGEPDVAWKWIDAHGGKFGLFRPIPGPDPAHTQSRGDWHKLALSLRESRLRTTATASAGESPAGKSKVVAKASW